MPSKYRGGGNVDVADGNYHPDQRRMSALFTKLTQKDKDSLPDRGCSKVKAVLFVKHFFLSPSLPICAPKLCCVTVCIDHS